MGNNGSKANKGKVGLNVDNEKYPGVPDDSPFGRMLSNWDQGRRKGKSRKKMVKYCQTWSQNPIQGDSVWWPRFGTDEDWVRQALILYVNSKPNVIQEESDYALCWLPVTISCKMKATTEDSEEQKEWEPLDHLPPPYVTPSAPQNDPSGDDDSGEGEEDGEEPPGASGVQTRSQAEKSRRQNSAPIARMIPLRGVPMGGEEGGTGYVNVPLTSTEVRNYKREMKGLLEDPMGLAEQLDQFLGPNTYTWDEMYSIMGILFSSQERQMIRQAALLVWEREGGAGGEQKFPLTDPKWDKKTEEGLRNMRDMREYWIKGIRQAAPKGHNFTKAFGNHQNPEETPTDFLDRIRKNLQQFAGVDPETDVGQQLIRVEFVSKAWPDIRKKLEKMDDWDSKPLSELLREAQKVFVRRDDEKQKKATKIMMQMVQQVTAGRREKGEPWQKQERGESWQEQRKRGPWPEQRKGGRTRGRDRETRRILRCYYCNEEGHFKRECPRYKREVRSYALMEED
ncbi:uncharacterized protein [Chiloscyllium punctatum]|uniref:uncharacterized protein isoform X1 n=1 Tax=Chiloscyllium punctatum TaxID=137246 RepID=UPI003B63F151